MIAIELARHIRHALGRELSSELSLMDVANAAGRQFCAAFDWSFLERPAADLDFVAGQTYVSLPSDYGRMLDVRTQSRTSSFYPVTMSVLNRKRTEDVNTLDVYGCVLWTPGTASSAPVPRLEVYPTPAANETDALRLFYRAKWTDLSVDTDTVQVPWYAENLIIELARARALGWEKKELAQELTQAVLMGSEMESAISADQGGQSELGRMEGGAAARWARNDHGVTNDSPWGVEDP